MIERPDREYVALSLRPQRRYRVLMTGEATSVVVFLSAGSIDSVIDQVKNRRIATPPGMTSFSVEEEREPEV